MFRKQEMMIPILTKPENEMNYYRAPPLLGGPGYCPKAG